MSAKNSYHGLGHALANAGTSAGTEEDLALEDVMLEDGGRVNGWWFDVSLGHGW